MRTLSRHICTIALGLWVSAAYAQVPALPGGKHDAKTPIEVTADQLEVQQANNLAIFKGHVVAIQGDVRLKSDTMTVYYSAQGDKKAAASPAPGGGSIKKIDADGNVFLSTTEETASGNAGTYDVENQIITLNKNVVLTRSKNVLKGDKLVYNFATGKSVLTSGGAETKPGQGGGRVRALFVPENNDTVKK